MAKIVYTYIYVLTKIGRDGKLGWWSGEGGGSAIVNENHSHLDTLAGARVPGWKPRVKSFLQIFFLTFVPEYGYGNLESIHRIVKLSSMRGKKWPAIAAGHKTRNAFFSGVILRRSHRPIRCR
jgi:hypothetical protein